MRNTRGKLITYQINLQKSKLLYYHDEKYKDEKIDYNQSSLVNYSTGWDLGIKEQNEIKYLPQLLLWK